MTESNNASTPEKPSKALIVKPSMGALASAQDPAELEAVITKRRDALVALIDDKSLSDATRLAVTNLAALASPNKPGLEEMVAAWKVPRINIVQPTSQSEAKPESAKNGDLYTTAGQLLEKPWGGIVLYVYEENINFPPQGKIPACSAPDAKLGSPFGECVKCPHLPFGKQNGGRGDQHKTDCQNNIVAVMASVDLSQVYLVQFGKTSRKAGSALLSLAGQQSVVWKQSYLLNTEKKTGDLGLYYIYKIEATSKDNSADTQKVCEALYGLYVAERKKFLADWYARPMRAPVAAIEAEGQFSGGALEAGLAGNVGVEADLSTPVTPTATSSKTSRTSSKPM